MSRMRSNQFLNVSRSCCLIAALCVVFASVWREPVRAQSGQVVRVTGRGASPYEAREDAIRQALQQAVAQLVIAQRLVENDELVLDQIRSTMNGFVNRFTPIAATSENGNVVIEADVEVAESRLVNFLAVLAPGKAEVDVGSLLAAAQAEQLGRQARAEVMVGLFRGFPDQALEVSPPTLSLDEQDLTMANIQVEARISPAFIQQLKQGLRALGAEPQPHVPRFSDDATYENAWHYTAPFVNVCFRSETRDYVNLTERATSRGMPDPYTFPSNGRLSQRIQSDRWEGYLPSISIIPPTPVECLILGPVAMESFPLQAINTGLLYAGVMFGPSGSERRIPATSGSIPMSVFHVENIGRSWTIFINDSPIPVSARVKLQDLENESSGARAQNLTMIPFVVVHDEDASLRNREPSWGRRPAILARAVATHRVVELADVEPYFKDLLKGLVASPAP